MKRKTKAIQGFVGLCLASVIFVFIPPKRNEAQPNKAQNIYIPAEIKVDSIAYYKHAKTIQDSINLIEARSLVKLTKQLNKRTRKRSNASIKKVEKTVVLRYRGDIYKIQPEQYASYLIVDVDSFLSEKTPTVNEFIDTSFVEVLPPKKQNLWQRIWKKKRKK